MIEHPQSTRYQDQDPLHYLLKTLESKRFELTKNILKPEDNVQLEERDEVSRHIKKVFIAVPVFTELWSGAVKMD